MRLMTMDGNKRAMRREKRSLETFWVGKRRKTCGSVESDVKQHKWKAQERAKVGLAFPEIDPDSAIIHCLFLHEYE
jgi:hypothetical protein